MEQNPNKIAHETRKKKRAAILRDRFSRVLLFVCLDILMLFIAAVLACLIPKMAVPAGQAGAYKFPLSYLADNGRWLTEVHIFTVTQIFVFAAIYLAIFTAMRLEPEVRFVGEF